MFNIGLTGMLLYIFFIISSLDYAVIRFEVLLFIMLYISPNNWECTAAALAQENFPHRDSKVFRIVA